MRTDIGRYAILPEWLLDAGVSSHAIRLFGLLAAKYADREGSCHPGRQALAAQMGVSVDTIDRAGKELVKAGALVISERWDAAGDRATNSYMLCFLPPGGRTDAATVAAPMRHKPDPLEPEILIPSESPKRAKSLSNPRRPFTAEDKAAFLEEFRGLPDVEGSIRKAMNSPGYQFGTDKYGHVRDWLLRDAERERRSHGTVGRNVRPGAQPQLPRSQAPGTHPGRAPDLVV